MKLPQLSLRELFWIVLVCAMGCGWWVDHSQMSRENERLAKFEQSFLGLKFELKASQDRLRVLQRVIATGGGTRDRREE